METNQLTQSKAALWTGRIISGLCILFLLVDSIMKIVRARASVEGTLQLGLTDNMVQPIGFLLLTCTIFYTIPRTALFGAILLSTYLGGAAAIMVQHFKGGSAFLFPVIFCLVVWAGLFLQRQKLISIIPVGKP